MKTKDRLVDWILSLGLFLIFLGLFLYRLTEITPGAWGDEISLGWMIDELNSTQGFVPFVTHNYGHPTPLIYLSALVVSVFGKSLWSLRLVSVMFGALSVGAFYFFLRISTKRYQALLGSLIYGTSYILIIVSRFAYEISAALFFFIVSGYCLVSYQKSNRLIWLVALAISLSLGLYTYLGFRSVLIVFFIFIFWLIRQKKPTAIIHLTVFMSVIFLLMAPLIIYSYKYPGAINARAESLSVFHQHLPLTEIIKELGGASFRTLSLFVFTGDPNPRQNPAMTIPFDYLTVGLLFIGLALLAKKHKKVFMAVFLFLGAILGAEIITLERIPEFHYYGLGHPNTLRIALILPLIIYTATIGLFKITSRIRPLIFRNFVLICLVLFIVIVNLNRYYHQKMNQWIYATNFVSTLKIIDYVNNNMQNQIVYFSPTLFSSQHLKYLLSASIKARKYLITKDCGFSLPESSKVFVGSEDLKTCTLANIKSLAVNPSLEIVSFISPWQTLDALLLIQKNTL